MTKRIALASLFAVALAAGVTQAQAQAPSAGGGNVVGGGLGATIVGGGDNLVIQESGKSLGLRGGSEIWLMEPAVQDSGADLKHAMCADR